MFIINKNLCYTLYFCINVWYRLGYQNDNDNDLIYQLFYQRFLNYIKSFSEKNWFNL